MLKDEKGHYADGYSLRWKPEDYGSIDIVQERDKHIYPFELYSFGTAAILFLAPRIREFVAGCNGVYGYDRKLRRIQYAFDTLELAILVNNAHKKNVGLKTIFEEYLSLEEQKKVQSGLNSFARNLKDMEY